MIRDVIRCFFFVSFGPGSATQPHALISNVTHTSRFCRSLLQKDFERTSQRSIRIYQVTTFWSSKTSKRTRSTRDTPTHRHAVIHVWIGWLPSLSTHFLLQREQQISLYLLVNNIKCSHNNYKSEEHGRSLTEWSLLTALSEAFEWRKSFERIVVESIT